MTARADRCQSWNPKLVRCRCIRKTGHTGQHSGVIYRHRTYWSDPT